MTVDPKTLSLILFPASILLEQAKDVDPSDPTVQHVARRMVEIMFEHQGVGLAAPQIGLPWRLFVTRNPDSEDEAIAWINPSLKVINEDIEIDEEGCLSLPDIRGDIRRPVGITIRGFDIEGNPAEMSSDTFMARVWQHENDHLDGILIIHKMTAMDRLVNRKLIRNLERTK